MRFNLSKPILYLITRGRTTEQTTRNTPEFAGILNQVSAAVAAGVELIQIREKKLTTRVLVELVGAAAELTRGTNTRLLVNDRADVAAGAGADGVHLTTHSLDAATIRQTFGDKLLIGVSTHVLSEGRVARDQGGDFIVFGPVLRLSQRPDSVRPSVCKSYQRSCTTFANFRCWRWAVFHWRMLPIASWPGLRELPASVFSIGRRASTMCASKFVNMKGRSTQNENQLYQPHPMAR